MPDNKLTALILSHGRPDRVYTETTLRKYGFTGDSYIIIDNEDKAGDEYKKIYGEKIIVFDKKAVAKTFDQADISTDMRAVVYARNACFDIAKNLGIKYFIQLDDDYDRFAYRFDGSLNYIDEKIKNLDRIFEILLNYYKSINAKSIAMAQTGDFMGGKAGGFARKIELHRKCMNSFICSTDRPFQFVGRINEDVNTYTWRGGLGDLFLTIPLVALTQKATQKNSGGMTELYLDSGTYLKSFYTVIFCPSCVTVGIKKDMGGRIHHKISWRHAVPKIIDEKYKK